MIDVYEDACVCASIHRRMTHEFRMHDSGNMQESLIRIVEQFTIQLKPAFPWWAVCLTVCIFLTFLQEILLYAYLSVHAPGLLSTRVKKQDC